jgi:hypothetical protein
MPDSSISEVPCANNELVTNTSNESDKLKIDTFGNLDKLLRAAEKGDLAAVRQVHFIYNILDSDNPYIDELRTARFLGALPRLQSLQLDGWTGMGRLLQTITDASATPFGNLKTIIWGSGMNPLDEMLPLWRLPVEHIEVSVGEPELVTRSRKCWPAPSHSLKRLNLHFSTIEHRTLEKLLHLSPDLELLRYDHWCYTNSESYS